MDVVMAIVALVLLAICLLATYDGAQNAKAQDIAQAEGAARLDERLSQESERARIESLAREKDERLLQEDEQLAERVAERARIEALTEWYWRRHGGETAKRNYLDTEEES